MSGDPASPSRRPYKKKWILINTYWWYNDAALSTVHIPLSLSLLLRIAKNNHIPTRMCVFLALYLKAFGKLKIHAPATCKDRLAPHRNAASEAAAVHHGGAGGSTRRQMAWQRGTGGILSSRIWGEGGRNRAANSGLTVSSLYLKCSGFLCDRKCPKPGTDNCWSREWEKKKEILKKHTS